MITFWELSGNIASEFKVVLDFLISEFNIIFIGSNFDELSFDDGFENLVNNFSDFFNEDSISIHNRSFDFILHLLDLFSGGRRLHDSKFISTFNISDPSISLILRVNKKRESA